MSTMIADFFWQNEQLLKRDNWYENRKAWLNANPIAAFFCRLDKMLYRRNWRRQNPDWRDKHARHERSRRRALSVMQRRELYRYENRIKLKTRLKVIKLLGARCANPNCLVSGGCDDIRCLQLDHIYGGGTQERKKFGKGGWGNYNMYLYYLKHPEEARKKLQVLCANCNSIKEAMRSK